MLADPTDDPREEAEYSGEAFDTDESTPETEDHKIMYSFDAPTGPADGRAVLNDALHQAVVKFEDGQTRRLVNDEYGAHLLCLAIF